MPPKRKQDPELAPKRDVKEINWAIKKPDSEPLLRYDIQHDVLHEIFADRTFRFTAPVDTAAVPAPLGPNDPPSDPIFLNFDQLYLEAVLSSMKTTQNLRNKLIDNPDFAVNFCKVALLINVGRINTTLAFYPSMKTALRTYHPIPSLQMDDASQKDMQDAPRIKGILKACFLDWEVTDQAVTLQDIARKSASGNVKRGPPTTVVTAIFHLFSEATWVSDRYLPAGFDLLDLFYSSNLPSKPRAHAFLSLLHHILESKTFINDFSSPDPSPIPLKNPIVLIHDEAEGENVDSVEELDYARRMKEIREGIVKTVPAIQKREEMISLREKKKEEKEKEKEGLGDPAAPEKSKRRKTTGTGKKSYARISADNETRDFLPEILPPGWETEDWSTERPSKSGLPLTWKAIKRDLEESRDPDYDSDEEAWGFDTLLRRQLLTIRNPRTGDRTSVKGIKEYDEWLRRRESGWVDETHENGAEADIEYPGDEMERSEAGDDD